MATFSWASAGDVGLGLLQGWASSSASRAQARAANDIREANNSVSRSSSMLARTIQNINNTRILEAGGKQLDAAQRSFSQAQDAFARRGFEGSVKQAEAAGQIAARAAAAGVGGASVQAMAGAAVSSLARQRDYMMNQQEAATYEQLQAMTSIMPNAIRSLDNSAIVTTQDFTRNRSGGMIGSLLSSLLGKSNSLHTLLGSLVGDDEGQYTNKDTAFHGPPGPVAESFPVRMSNPKGLDLQPGANTSPVWEYRVQGTPLPPITIK